MKKRTLLDIWVIAAQSGGIQNELAYGIKGPSWLLIIPNYNVIQGKVIDLYALCVIWSY